MSLMFVVVSELLEVMVFLVPKLVWLRTLNYHLIIKFNLRFNFGK